MRVLIQRVGASRVEVDGAVVGAVERGLLVYVGVAKGDTEADVDYLVRKVRFVRVFPDPDGKMNLDVVQVAGGVLAISSFTLLADAAAGRRPGFDKAATPDEAQRLYDLFCLRLGEEVPVARGVFGAMMHVHSINDGPINLIIDSPARPPPS